MRMYMRLIVFAALGGAVVLSSHARVKAGEEGAAAIGKPAPDFTLTDQNGKTVKLADFKGKIVVLQWMNPDCPFVQRHYQEQTFVKLDDTYRENGVVQLAINSGAGATTAENKAFADLNHVKYAILNDSAGAMGRAYGAKSTPHMFVINQAGMLIYKGAIDNDPDGSKTTGRMNYVAKALEEMIAGHSVSEPETKSYGCGIHFK